MKMDIKLEGVNRLMKQLDDISRKQVPYAAAKAINDTAKETKKVLVKKMKSVFRQPTKTTLNSIIILYAKKTSLVGYIKIKDMPFGGGGKSPADYLRPQIFGGPRPMKRSEKLLKGYYVPGRGIKLNKFGNISQGKIQQILSATGRQFDKHQRSTKKSKKRNVNVRNVFQVRKTGRTNKHLHPGVYKRTGSGLRPLLISVNKAPRYITRFRFHYIVTKEVKKRLSRNFDKAFAHAMKTARR